MEWLALFTAQSRVPIALKLLIPHFKLIMVYNLKFLDFIVRDMRSMHVAQLQAEGLLPHLATVADTCEEVHSDVVAHREGALAAVYAIVHAVTAPIGDPRAIQ